MNDVLLIVVVLVGAIGGLVAVAYWLEKRSKKSNPVDPVLPEPGPMGKIALWSSRILVVLMVLAIIGALVLKSLPLVWFAAGCLAFYYIEGIIFRVIRLIGK